MWETREIVVPLAKMRKSGREWHLMANFRQVEKYFLSLSANTEACCFLSQLFAFVSCIFFKDYLIITEKCSTICWKATGLGVRKHLCLDALFIQIFIKHLLYAMYCARHQVALVRLSASMELIKQ